MSAQQTGLQLDAAGDQVQLDADLDSVLLAAANPADVSTPPPPAYSVADYAEIMNALKPYGDVWPRECQAVQWLAFAALSRSGWRADRAAGALIADVFPATAIGMLPEWEAALGLPDPCAGPAPTLQARQAQVVTKFVNSGGQSVGFFVLLAASLGYAITITEFGGSAGGDPHHWQVNCPSVTRFYFRAGRSAAGEPLVVGGSSVLECVFQELKPAHTTVSFNYAAG